MPEELDAQEILRRTAAAYRLFETYQDTGYVYSIHNPGKPDERHSSLAFKTTFQRPDLFRFEWREKDLKGSERCSVIWSDGQLSNSRVFGRNTIVDDDCDRRSLVQQAAGPSHGTAHATSALLMDGIGGIKLTARRPIEFVDSERQNDEDCFRLHHPGDHEIDLWISTKRSVVVKIFEQYDVDQTSDPHQVVLNEKFRSFKKFFRWLRLRKALQAQTSLEPFHVIDQTFYTDIRIDATLQRGAFSYEGVA